MRVFRAVLFLAGLVAAPAVSAAQKTIRISDSLARNGERLKVERGAQWMGHIGKWRFGDYAGVSGETRRRNNKNPTKFFPNEEKRPDPRKHTTLMCHTPH